MSNMSEAWAAQAGEIAELRKEVDRLSAENEALCVKIVNEVDARGRLFESVRKAREENEKSRGLLAEVAGSGVELRDDRMRYLVVQIGRDLWAKVTEASKP